MKQVKLFSHAVILCSTLTFGCLDTAYGARAVGKPPVPDFTQGGKQDGSHDWLKTLRPYGVHAQTVLPQLKEMSRRARGRNKELDKLIADIETATDSPTLVDLKDYIARASASADTSNNIK